MKTLDVVALGELLIDFTTNGISKQGNPLLEANPGGAPCNVLAMLTKLGHQVAFMGKVGDDGFGHQLEKAILEQGIDAKGLLFDPEIHTTLAIVLKKDNGDRDFAFYRKPGADIMIKEDEINEELIQQAKVFHFGTLSLTDHPAIEATYKAIEFAKKHNCIITFDPNLREPLWDSLEKAHEMVAWGLSKCDVLKISDNEIQWFTGKEDYDEGIEVLKKEYPNIKLITLSMGPDGSRAYFKDIFVEQKAFIQEGDVETTGCGDTFCANVIHTVLTYGFELDEKILSDMLIYANAAASIVSKRKGALRVMPTIDEIESFLSNH